MKITRRQLSRLIEGSIKKRGDYVIPVEDPIGDPSVNLDYSDDQKTKIKMLAMSDDEENQTHADFIADIGGYEGDDRFGADTFSKKVQAAELGVDMLTDPDIDSAIATACDYWVYENKDSLSYFDHIDQDDFKNYSEYMIDNDGGDQAVVDEIKVFTIEVLDKRIKSLIDISNSAAPVPSVDEKVAYYENAKKLFLPDHNNPIVADHVIFKLKSVLYPFYLDWKSYYEKEQGYDMNNPEHVEAYEKQIATFKEGKIKISRGQLRKLIKESLDKTVPLFSNTEKEIEAMRQAARSDLNLGQANRQKLDTLEVDDPNQVRALYQALGSEEPDMSVEEEEDYIVRNRYHELASMLGDGIYDVDPAILSKFAKSLSYPFEVWFMEGRNFSHSPPDPHAPEIPIASLARSDEEYLRQASEANSNKRYPMLDKVKDGIYSLYGYVPIGPDHLGLDMDEKDEFETAIYLKLPQQYKKDTEYLIYRAILHYQPDATTKSAI